MCNHIKISKKLEWIRLFLPSVKHLVNLKKLKEIRSYRVPDNKDIKTYAQCCRYDNGTYSITVLTHSHVIKSLQGKLRVYTRAKVRPLNEILCDIAHELAHMACWRRDGVGHTPNRLRVEGKMISCFARRAEQFGVTDTYRKFTEFAVPGSDEPTESS